jgi:hypothetical protein
MKMSPRRFRNCLHEALLELHWRQWCALGVPGQVEPEEHWVIDLEALAVSTFGVGAGDRRLLKLARQWLVVNRVSVNTARLKRIGDEFKAARLLSATELSALLRSVCGNAPRAFAGRLKLARLVVSQPVLLQLQLRALFGMDARADVFGYLLFNDSGNSSSIARSLRLHQKSAYRVLERWSAAGVVQRTRGGYALEPEAIPPSIRDAAWGGVKWLNWASVYRALDRLYVALALAHTDDAYVASSLFRDVQPEAEAIARTLDVRLPSPARHPGATYFEPFAAAAGDILARLLRTGLRGRGRKA